MQCDLKCYEYAALEILNLNIWICWFNKSIKIIFFIWLPFFYCDGTSGLENCKENIHIIHLRKMFISLINDCKLRKGEMLWLHYQNTAQILSLVTTYIASDLAQSPLVSCLDYCNRLLPNCSALPHLLSEWFCYNINQAMPLFCSKLSNGVPLHSKKKPISLPELPNAYTIQPSLFGLILKKSILTPWGVTPKLTP